jgi:hypothetical protein
MQPLPGTGNLAFYPAIPSGVRKNKTVISTRKRIVK